jgi:hypothetical protein
MKIPPQEVATKLVTKTRKAEKNRKAMYLVIV